MSGDLRRRVRQMERMRALAAKPLTVVFRDMHEGDEAFAARVEAVARADTDQRVLVVSWIRPSGR